MIDAKPTTEVRAARRAVLAIFFINGAIIASWVAHIPLIKEKFNLTPGELGFVLLAAGAGSIVALTMIGGLVARLGSRLVTSVGAIACCASLPLLLLVPNVPLLVASLAFFGMANATVDVAMNSQAVAVEARYGRPIMSTFHALFSAGGLVGAAVGSLLLARNVSTPIQALGIVLTLGLIVLLALRHLLPAGVDQASDAPAFIRPSGPLLNLGLLALFALISEGAMADWSAVYLHTSLGAAPDFAAIGFAVFSLTMTLGRFVGDRLRARLHAVQVVRLSGALGALGLGIALFLGQPVAALIGFGCVGFGLSNLVPVLFSAAGSTPGMAPGAGIAAVATAGYLGFLIGPPLIGLVAQTTTLPLALGLVALCMALIALRAVSVASADEHIANPALTSG
ncbi:MAG: MFS transporter [Herpetosiphonaceae bacterium]|nr:MFS transporter [Herpetosiphonaceae bacterium]